MSSTLFNLVDVSAGYGDRKALCGISLEVCSHETLVVLGPNGAGKSSLLRVLTGKLPPRTGSVISSRGNVSRFVELVPQDLALYPFMTSRENCIAFASINGAARVTADRRATEVLKAVGCAEMADTRVSRLSGGYKKRVDIAVSLMESPAVLALDEPSSGLDADGRSALIEILNGLRANGTGLVVVTHDFELADTIGDRVALLVDGRLIADALCQKAIEQVFNVEKIVEVDLLDEPEGHRLRVLRSIGLQKSFGNAWTMCTLPEADLVERLSTILKDLSLRAREIRIRSPSLKDLYRHYVAGIAA